MASLAMSLSFASDAKNGPMTVFDVMNVAVSNQPIEALFTLPSSSPSPTEEPLVIGSGSSDIILNTLKQSKKETISSEAVTTQTTRAGLFCRLYSLCQNPDVVKANDFYIVKSLLGLLNSNITPVLGDSASAGMVMVTVMVMVVVMIIR